MKEIVKKLKNSKKIALFSHQSPDPDTIGSTLALKNILVSMGKDVSVFCCDNVPSDYDFVGGKAYFCDQENFDGNLGSFDLLVAVDVADKKMLGKFEESFISHPNTLKIDHHKTSENFAKENYVSLKSATALIIYELSKKLKVKLSGQVATQLYFAICGDTSIFRNNNTDAETLFVAAKLIELGAENQKVLSEFFDKRTIGEVLMTSTLLLSSEIDEKLGFAIMVAEKKDYEKFGINPENDRLSNLPNTLLSTGLKISVILKEKSDGIHCSFRSKQGFDVSKIAGKFGGGGHTNAAGCTVSKPLSQAKRDVADEIKNYFKENAEC